MAKPIVYLVVAALLISCGQTVSGSSVEGASSGDLAVLEARWQCDVQRRAYASLEEMQADLDSRLRAAGYTAADYEEFKRRLAEDAEARGRVLDTYEAYCSDQTVGG